jgi:putative phage-type endonuclease
VAKQSDCRQRQIKGEIMIEMMEQGTDEWFAARIGKVTASRVADVIAKTKTGFSTSRDNYMAQLVCERLTGQKSESFTNAAMQWGTETEPLARLSYEVAQNVLVDEVGFVPHPSIIMAGASPDGLVGDDGLLEIKCPNTATHIETLLSQTVPGKYNTQMQFQMACTNRSWCDFVSFDNRLPSELQLFVKRVPRDNMYIRLMEEEIVKFLNELDIKIAQLMEIKNVKNT